MQDTHYLLTCEIVNQNETLSLAQMCHSAGVHAEWVTLLVEQGVLEPVTPHARQWQFSATDLPRLHTACRLAHDLDLSVPGIALALELMDEVRSLRARLNALEP